MPSISDIVLAAIAILATLAFALALAPTFVWLRRRMAGPGEQEKRTEGSLDPKAIERELGARPAPTAVDEAADEAAGAPTADPTLEDRIIRIVSWAFLMAVAVFAAASGLWNSARRNSPPAPNPSGKHARPPNRSQRKSKVLPSAPQN